MDLLKSADILLQEGNDKHDILLFVETSLWHGNLELQSSKELKVVLNCINTKLNDPKARLEGLLLMSSFVTQMSPEVFSEHFQQWIQHLRKIAVYDADERLRCLAIRIFRQISQIAIQYPEHQRQIAANVASAFIFQLLEMDESCDLTVAHGLSVMLKFFPGPSRQHLGRIQNRITDMLIVKNLEIVEVAATCMSFLPFITGGDRGKTNSQAWLDLYTKLCHTLHFELSRLYENFEIDEHVSVKLSEQFLLPFSAENVDATSLFLNLYRRVTGICLCLQKLLENGNEVLVTVPIGKSLDLIYRILKINGVSLALHETEDCQGVLLHAVLPMIHKEALLLLEKLLLSCKKHMLLHEEKIFSLIQQTLQWTSVSQPQNEFKSSFRRLRGIAFRVLITWLTVAGSAVDIGRFGDFIVRQLLRDAFPEQSVTETGLANDDGVSKSKRMKVSEVLLSQNQRRAHVVNDHTTHLALKALNIILITSSEDLQIATLKDIEAKVLSWLMKFQCGSSDLLAFSFNEDSHYCVALYELLLALLLTPALSKQVLLAKSMHIFSSGQKDASSEVLQICYRGLALCRSLIEPIRRSLPMQPIAEAKSASMLVDTSNELSDQSYQHSPASLVNNVEFVKENVKYEIMKEDFLDPKMLGTPSTSRTVKDLLDNKTSKMSKSSTELTEESFSSKDSIKNSPEKTPEAFNSPLMAPNNLSTNGSPSPNAELYEEAFAEHQIAAGEKLNFEVPQPVHRPRIIEVDLEDSSPERESEPADKPMITTPPKMIPEESSMNSKEFSPKKFSLAKHGDIKQICNDAQENRNNNDTVVDELPYNREERPEISSPCGTAANGESLSTQAMLASFVNSHPDDDASSEMCKD